MYTEDLRVGQRYGRLRKCISISILDFNLTDGERYHSMYTLKDQEGRELTDLFEVHIIELKKELRGEGAVEDWIRLFNVRTGKELDALQTANKGVQEAMEVVRTMNLGRTLRAMYEAHLKAVRDRWAEDEYVRDEGRVEGEAVGRTLGEALGKADAVLQLLSLHGEVPEELRERIMAQRDIKVLDEWHLLAARIGDIQEFKDKIDSY